MATRDPAPTLNPFLVCTSPDGFKPQGDSRLLIRRHVMKGKNKRPPPTASPTTIFLDTHGLETEYPDLARRLRRNLLPLLLSSQARSCEEQDGGGAAERDKFNLWAIYSIRVSGILNTSGNQNNHTAFRDNKTPKDDDDPIPRLHEEQVRLRRRLGLNSWFKTRQILRSFLWVDVVNDGLGKLFYDTKGAGVAGDEGIL